MNGTILVFKNQRQEKKMLGNGVEEEVGLFHYPSNLYGRLHIRPGVYESPIPVKSDVGFQGNFHPAQSC